MNRFFYSICIIFSSSISALQPNNPLSSLKEEAGISEREIDERETIEFQSFLNIYEGGYYEGNPEDSRTKSTFGQSVNYQGSLVDPLYVCYAECIKPYVQGLDVLEIGPGRGAWTKAIAAHRPKSISCVDVLSASHNKFWDYVGLTDKIKYHQITDLSLDCISDNSIDYVFSFGVFCHISPLLIERYLNNLYPKLRKGAKCFILYADFDKYNAFSLKYEKGWFLEKENETLYYKDKKAPQPAQWYHLGIARIEQLVTALGYQVISPDIQINERDPMIFFTKP